jgi:type I restriction enzyme M protein
MASSATDSQGKDKDIREQLIKTGNVDVMMSVSNNFFYTKSLPCSLWFFDKGKVEGLKNKVLFIDARNYYTVVDRTLNEWSEWQLKNMNAIVWLYRGETDKYVVLLNEYKTALGSDKPFAEQVHELSEKAKAFRTEAKKAVDKKKTQAEYDEKLAEITEVLTIAKEAHWLYEKFGEGVYSDVLGLCKVADLSEIEEKGWSLTPGAYVGVAPVEDDGVDFEERMAEIHRELLSLQAESNDLMDIISQNMKEMGL